MLSNKLTFSLASLVVLLVAFLCLPIVVDANVDVRLPAGDIAKDGLVVYGNQADGGVAALGADSKYTQVVAVEATTGDDAISASELLPDLNEFFGSDWMIEIIVHKSAALAPKDLVISEIMWGLDAALADLDGDDTDTNAPTAMMARQWIEFYNTSGEAINVVEDNNNIGNGVMVLFTHVSGVVPTGNYINVAHADTNAETDDVQGEGVFTFDEIRKGSRKKADDKDLTKDDPHTHVVLDRVSNLDYHATLGFRGRWTLPGQSGRTAAPTDQTNFPQEALISASRKINYNAAADKLADGVPSGTDGAQWEATDPFARRNTNSPLIVANPGVGVDPGDYSKVEETDDPAADKIVINEIYNNSDNDLDWIEIKNIMEPGSEDSDINIENWEIAYVDGEETKNLVDLPKYILGAQEILLIVSRDPGETILAGGVNVEVLGDPNEDQLNKGAQHRYYIQDGMSIPGSPLLLILRDNHEKNKAGEYHNNIQDTAGGLEQAGYAADRSGATLVFPFKGKASIAVADRAVDVGKAGSAWARKPKGMEAGYYDVDNKNGRAKAAWESVTGATTMGVGYDRNVDLDIAHGTPGYENMIANTVDDFDDTDPDPDGMEIASDLISISEVMYDAGPRWNQVQWIELYNASMTQAVNIAGWELEIRNATDAVESYVDSSFIFNDAVILPNQTLLIVSGPGANDVPGNRVYNLFAQHRRELGLTQRGSVLLSPDGFYLKLTDKANITRDDRTDEDVVVDEAGNVTVDGASRIVAWELPERGDVRQSLIRQYGSRMIDGSSDAADAGTMAESWVLSDVSGAGLAYFGHRDDVGTPGYRLGGPLPVSLASFRPVRDKATGEVVITWVTESELNNAGFNILRAESKDGEFQVINLTGIIAGHGTTSEKHVYSYTDKTAKPNVAYYYQIEDVSLNGNRTTLRTTHMRGNVNASGKLTTTWSNLKLQK